jgi:hypothetical protein
MLGADYCFKRPAWRRSMKAQLLSAGRTDPARAQVNGEANTKGLVSRYSEDMLIEGVGREIRFLARCGASSRLCRWPPCNRQVEAQRWSGREIEWHCGLETVVTRARAWDVARDCRVRLVAVFRGNIGSRNDSLCQVGAISILHGEVNPA